MESGTENRRLTGETTESFRVTELVRLFQSGLLALIPVMDQARIKWTGSGVYDPWEGIERTLFGSIIGSCVENAVGSNVAFPLAPYGLLVPTYERLSFLTARHLREGATPYALLELVTDHAPFDTAAFVELGPDLKRTGEHAKLAVASVDFEIAFRSAGGTSHSESVTYHK